MTINQVKADDVTYALSLAKKFTDNLGFLPRPAVEFYAMNGGAWQVNQNGQPAGFVIAAWTQKVSPRTACIYQAAVQLDAQRIHLGLALISHVCDEAASRGSHEIVCWCAADLQANYFWRAAEFTLMQTAEGGRRRKRHMLLWAKRLAHDRDTTTNPRVLAKRPGGRFGPINQERSPVYSQGSFLISY